MPTKRNKKRYQATPKPTHPITLSGRIFLLYRDDEKIEKAQKGDLRVSPSSKELHSLYMGMYDTTGFDGYFRLDVYSGKDWLPIILQSVFENKEHYFSKHECPIDVFNLIEPMLESLKSKELIRKYREHYELSEEENA